MLSRKILGTVEGLCRFLINNNDQFGGLQFILVGDFYQLRPVPNMLYGDYGEVFFFVLPCVGACNHSVKS